MQDIKTIIKNKYPKTYEDILKIMDEQLELFCKKQHDYGPSNISMGGDKELSLLGLAIRKNDKVQRLLNILHKNKGNTAVEESLRDTLMDLSIYGIIAQVVLNDNWGE